MQHCCASTTHISKIQKNCLTHQFNYSLVFLLCILGSGKEKDVQRDREKENDHCNAKQTSSSASRSHSRSPVEPKKLVIIRKKIFGKFGL